MKYSKTTILPTESGTFNMFCIIDEDETEHAVLYKGHLEEKEDVYLRVHSECLTGDVFHSLKCDCGEQLKTALNILSEKENSILIYLRQEGRGIGLFNKINAYNLQDDGFDTIDANIELGFSKDKRTYEIVIDILNKLKVKSIILLTNNPDKVNQIVGFGITITKRIPLVIKPNSFNARYLHTKKIKMNHLI